MTRLQIVLAAASAVLAVACGLSAWLLAGSSGPHHGLKSLPIVAPSVTPRIPAAVSPAAAAAKSVPVKVAIPAIGVSATIIPEGTDAAGALQVPPLSGPQASDVGWWDGNCLTGCGNGYTPGQNGKAVLAGHVNSAAMGNLVFASLGKLTDGDRIEVFLASGQQVWFTVTALQEVGKNAFPTSQVYGPATDPELRLITCVGAFDPATGHYVDNLIVYATAVA